ncbi:MAG: prolipoprotein diacylglyceryl transferase family protein [Micropepsaceae bacterium]
MIEIPTNPAYHLLFDTAAWGTSILVGIILYKWRLKGLTSTVAQVADGGYFTCLAIGAILGAYLSGSLTFWGQGTFALAHSVAGALAGGILGVELYKLVRGIRMSTGIVFVGPFAAGVTIGRWGCLFAGIPDQTFGTPSELPWAVDLGDGIGRHPVQVYESISMAVFTTVFLLGLRNRAHWAMKGGFYWLAIFYGTQRFLWEFLKPYPPLIGPLNHFHLMCLGLVVYGSLMLRRNTSSANGENDTNPAE